MSQKQPMIFCLGEVVWDLFPQGPVLGGAPFNVAVHLARQGLSVALCSAVGRDALGAKVQAFLRAEGIPELPLHPHLPTGTVDVTVDPLGLPCYTIHDQAAWTDLEGARPGEGLSGFEPEVLVFGGVAMHCPGNRRVLQGRLASAQPPLALCDLNLRPGWSNPEVALWCLERADVLKVNQEELNFLLDLLDLVDAGALMDQFHWQGLCTTLGPQGLRWQDRGGFSLDLAALAPPQAPPLVDTVGAGDAITASLALGLARGEPAPVFLESGRRAAARVCGVQGALPNREKS